MNNVQPPLLAALSESRGLAADISRYSELQIAPIEERDFDGGEFKLRPLMSVRNRSVIVVQSLAGSRNVPIALRLVRLLFLLFGLRDAGASETAALIPYLCFARKDRRTQPRDPVTTRYVAQLLEATAVHRLMLLDVHNPAALDNAFRVPVDHLSALPLFADHIAAGARAADIAIASPDVGGIKRAQLLCELLQRRLRHDPDLVFIEKRRAGGVVSGGQVVGNVTGRHVVVVDDLCATGGTLLRAARALRNAGATAVRVVVTHSPHPAGLAALAAGDDISAILTTDSVGAMTDSLLIGAQKLTTLPIAPLFGNALGRILRREPLTPLFE